MMHFSKAVPSIPVQREMRLAAVAEARSQVVPKPSWSAIFVRALALVAAETPELRRVYLSFPWPHLYEHTVSIASVATERSDASARFVDFVRVRNPARHSIAVVDRYLRRVTKAARSNAGLARFGSAITLLPWPLRRALWWCGLNLNGYFRARAFGTFGLSVYSALGAESLHPLSPLSFLLNYGVISAEGNVNVRIVYDHRITDGANIARALAALEAALTGPLCDELLALAATQRARRTARPTSVGLS
ncbi:MAG TPA: hypothetical protein VG713_18850 [Pirellulales bacterium]|nr:hypothetical protein [Pirellulales bacterium]